MNDQPQQEQPQTALPQPAARPSSWQFFKKSFDTLNGDKEMLLFPLFGGLFSILAAFALFMLFFLLVPGETVATTYTPDSYIVYGFLFIYYLIQYFIISYFNAGLASAVIQRYAGQDPTFRSGMQQANQHIPQIFGYSVIAATIGVFLQFVADKLKLGWIVSLIIDTAWSVATIFVIPVLVTTNKGPIQGIKESARILKTTWGSNVKGWFGFGLITLLGLLISVLPLIAVFVITSLTQAHIAVVWVGFGMMALGILATSLIVTTCTTIFRVSLYHFATTRQLPPGFENSGLEHAVKTK